MHGIECLNRELHQDYESMSPEKLAAFVSIDGHIGLEEEEAIAARFGSFFSWVQTEPRYTLCLSAAEFIKQHDQYGVPFERDFVEYLRGLSFDERHAFDMAMGYVFGKISELGIRLPPSGLYLLLKASNTGPEPFYDAHRDRSDLFFRPSKETRAAQVCLDTRSRAVFGNGWYPANRLPPIARWMSERSQLEFEAGEFSRIQLQLITHIPQLNQTPMELRFELNGSRVCEFSLIEYGWLELEMAVPKEMTRSTSVFKLEIRANRTWQPSIADPQSHDDRYLSIAVCNIEIT
jgi:hypothetical protein